MVAVVPPLLSADPPKVPLRAGLGDRFHYFRGSSGQRYLFSEVPLADLGTFASAVAMLARRTADGRLAAHAVFVVDPAGRGAGRQWAARYVAGRDTVALIHLLAGSDEKRHALVDDLTPVPSSAALAA